MSRFPSIALSGLVMSFLGLVAILFPFFSTYAIDSLLGSIFLIAGILHLLAVFDEKTAQDFIWGVVIGTTFLITGVLFIAQPFYSAMALTMILMLFFLIQGVASLVSAMRLHETTAHHWWWTVISSFFSIAIAVIIWTDFPETAGWFVETLCGVYMVLLGFSLMARSGSVGKD